MDIQNELQKRYGKSHLSYSSLKQALGDPMNFDRYMKGELKYESDALSFGTLYDMLLFEREKAMDTVMIVSHDVIMDKCSDKTRAAKNPKLTNEYKAVIAAMKTEAIEENKIICSPDDWKQANEMIDRLADCGLIESHLNGTYQVEFNEELDGVLIKGFLDCLGSNYISDSKSTKSVEKFRYSVRDFSYDIQAYIYTKIFNIKDFYWVVQEKNYPYLPALVKCSENTLFTGEMKFQSAVSAIEKFLSEPKEFNQYYIEYEV